MPLPEIFPVRFEQLQKGAIDPTPLITPLITFDEAPAMYNSLFEKKALMAVKVFITPV